MVTPDYTSGFNVLPRDTGAGILIGESFGAFGGSKTTRLHSQYQFARTPSGWATTPLDPPASQLPQNESSIEAFSPDLRSSVSRYAATSPAQSTPSKKILPARTLRPLHRDRPRHPPRRRPQEEVHFSDAGTDIEGTSTDLSHIFFTSDMNGAASPWPGDETLQQKPSLLEYTGTANSAPTEVAVSGGAASKALISRCGAQLGGDSTGSGDHKRRLPSGETAFFTALACEGGPPVNEIYARLHGSETVAISEPSAADCSECQLGSPQDATYLTASADASKVLFSTEQELLPGNPGDNLYLYDFGAAAGHRLSAITHLPGGEEASFQGLASASGDLSRIYFVAKGILAGKNAAGNSPTEGQDNLYVYQPDPASPGHQRTVFIATLAKGFCNGGSGTVCSGDSKD